MSKLYNRTSWIYVCFFVSATAIQVLLSLLLRRLGLVTEENRAWISIAVSCVSMYGVGFFLSKALFSLLPKGQGVQQEHWSLGKRILYFIICMSFMYIGNLIGNAMMFAVGVFTGKGMPTNQMTELLMESNAWLNLLSMVILAPIVEEWLFRKLLLDRITRFGQLPAVLLSAFFFALAHGNFYQFFYAFGLGALFAYLYVKTGKIRYTIEVHMAINFLGGIVAPELVKWQQRMADRGPLFWALPMMMLAAYGLLLIGCTIAGIVLFCCNVRQIHFLPARERTEGEHVLPALAKSPGFWVYLLYSAVILARSVMV